MSKIKSYYILIFILLLFIPLSVLYIDRGVSLYFIQNSDSYNYIGEILSKFGKSEWYISTGVIGYVFFKYFKKNTLFKERFLFLFYINIFSGFISVILKWTFGRVRPWGIRDGGDNFGFLLFRNTELPLLEKIKIHFATLIDSPGTYASFPSGHTTTVVAIATYLTLLFPRYIYLWFGFALASASGRILATDHFVSDVVAGFIVGTLSTLYLYSKQKEKLH
jgi:membrane-associated phospholipid phosphatase